MTWRMNQYRSGISLILRRLAWDVSPLGVVEKRRLTKWKNIFEGRRAVILCNGPSLNLVDFDRLQSSGVFTFGLNKINLIFERTKFRPSVVVSINPYVIQQNATFFNNSHMPLFLSKIALQRRYVARRENIHFLHLSGPPGAFGADVRKGVNPGHTVTYVALQLAFFMGFSDVALVGCDHSFSTKGPPNQTVLSGTTDADHFDPRYFAGGMEWQLPDLVASEFHYQVAGTVFREDGRGLLNCTVGGKLELFPRGSLEDFLDGR